VILLDYRIGSSDLYSPLRSLNVPVEITTLEAGDVAWLGRGPDESLVPCAIEIKRVGDLLQSITSGRLVGEQLPKLIHNYQRVWLLVEGRYRAGADGLVETRQGPQWAPLISGRGPMTYRAVESFLTTLEVRTGIHLRHTFDREETAVVIAALYSWWTGKAWEEHHAHHALHHPITDADLLYKPSLRRRIAAELPGIGVGKSAAVADHFPSVRALVEADEIAWTRIPGIGKGLAKKITEAINGSAASQ
jgi:ERCC4-type nuclease